MLWTLIESLLAKDPDARPPSAAETAEALAALAPSLTDTPALSPMPAPTFQPATARRITPRPQTQAIQQPSAATAPDAQAPATATAANLTIDAPARQAGLTPVPASQPLGSHPSASQPPGGQRPARPWFRRPALVTALGLTLAGLTAIAAIAAIGHHPGTTRAGLGATKSRHTLTQPSPTPTHPSPTPTQPSPTPTQPSPTATTTSPAPPAVTSLSISPSAIQMFQNQIIALNLQGQLANGSSASEQALAGATWTSANPDIADVSGAGVVTATGTGSTYITASLGGALASANLVVASNPSTSTTSPGAPATYTYQVFHTCRGPQHACGLEVRSGPGTTFAPTQLLHNNDVVQIVCQAAGELETNSKGVSSQVWDKLQQGGYVSDLYIDTPGARISATESGFTSTIPRCTS